MPPLVASLPCPFRSAFKNFWAFHIRIFWLKTWMNYQPFSVLVSSFSRCPRNFLCLLFTSIFIVKAAMLSWCCRKQLGSVQKMTAKKWTARITMVMMADAIGHSHTSFLFVTLASILSTLHQSCETACIDFKCWLVVATSVSNLYFPEVTLQGGVRFFYVSNSTASTRTRAQQQGVIGGCFGLPPTFHLLVTPTICIRKTQVQFAPTFMEMLMSLKWCQICEVIDFFVS